MVDLSFRFDLWHARLPRSPRDVGRVEACVVRPAENQRRVADALEVRVGAGSVGDSWSTHEYDAEGNQVSLVNVHVLRSLAGDDLERRALSGDNLQVDLDLSEASLPVGSRLHVGEEVVLEVSPVIHRPCEKFHDRYGKSAAQKVARANRRGKRGRGVLCSVAHGGTIRVGDAIRVERP